MDAQNEQREPAHGEEHALPAAQQGRGREKHTGRRVFLGVIIASFVFLFVVGAITGGASNGGTAGGATPGASDKGSASSVAANRSAATNMPPAATSTPTPLDQFPDVASYLAGNNNDSPGVPRLRSFHYDRATGTVDVDFTMDQNLTMGMTRDGIKIDMSTIYTDVFRKSSAPVQTANVTAWGPFTDKYGNTSYAPAYATTLTKDDADQINWSQDTSVLNLDIIPGVWTVTYAQPSLGF